MYNLYIYTHIYIYCTCLPNLQIRKTGRYSLDVIPISFAAVLDAFRMCPNVSWFVMVGLAGKAAISNTSMLCAAICKLQGSTSRATSQELVTRCA